MKENKEGVKSGILVIVLLLLTVILVLLFPKIYNLITTFSMPKVEDMPTTEEVEDKKIINEEVLETIHYPMMRNSVYDINTYYSLEKFTVNDLSNNDILLNAFLDIYEGNMTSYEGVGACTTISKQFDSQYLDFRVKNILGSRLEYIYTNFYVPEDLNTQYVGNWNYDSINRRFVYVGLCESRATNIKYYDLEELIKVEYNEKDIEAYYYVGFAKVDGSNYTIYKNSDMTEEIASGSLTTIDELDSIYKNINKNNKKIYKYIFKNTLCKYNEYCLYEGKWVSDI